MRSGKSFEYLLTAQLLNAQRVLVLCPSISKGVWAQEIDKWLGGGALLLEGLNCDTALLHCTTCHGKGWLPTGEACAACRARNGSAYGYKLITVHRTEEPTIRRAQTYGTELWRCRKHPFFTSDAGTAVACRDCKTELADHLRTVRFTVVNYELLTPQGREDAHGVVRADPTLRGWMGVLERLDYEYVVLDESHQLRAVKFGTEKLRDRVKRVAANADRALAISGTPTSGRPKNLWSQLDIISNGLFGTYEEFTTRYCAGHKGPFGWNADGMSNAEELKARLDVIKIQRPLSEILPHMPKKQRMVHRVDPEGQLPHVARRAGGTPRGSIMQLIAATAPIKREHVVRNVIAELAEGHKSYVLTFRRDACQAMVDALQHAMRSREHRATMQAVRADVWAAQTEKGVDATKRKALADSFVEHDGAGVFVATIRSMPGSISLRGVRYVHVADWDMDPDALEQAVNRPYEPGTTGLIINHYTVRGSIDEDFEAIVLPKFEAMDALLNDPNAREYLDAFRLPTAQETIEQIWARHTAHLANLEDDD